jgi:hypothetical protein
MKILFKYPSRGRSLKFFRALDAYYKLMAGDDFEFVISLDADDVEMNNEIVLERLKNYKNLSYYVGNSKSKIEAINANLEGKEFDILVTVSDDMIPEVSGYDDIIREEMKRNFPDTDGILWFYDGWRRDLNTLSILGKKYYDRFGYIYHPAYKSFWCDSEFTDVGNILKKQVFLDRVIIRHLHPDIVMQDKLAFDKFSKILPEYTSNKSYGHDLTWKNNSIPGDPDQKIYNDRKSRNFDIT